MSWSFIDIVFLITLLLLAVIPKKKKLWIIIWSVVFIANFLIRIYFIENSHQLRSDLTKTKEMAMPNELSVSSIYGWQNMELSTGQKTGQYLAEITVNESIPGKALGRITVTAIAEHYCKLHLGGIGMDNFFWEKPDANTNARLISFTIGKPPLKIKVINDCPSRITIIGSHGIGSFSFELSDDLPSQKLPVELRPSVGQTGANNEN